MNAEVKEVAEETPTQVEVREKEQLFSKKNRRLLTTPLNDDNPITVQVLGICSALAITVKLEPAIVMSLSVLFVLGVGNVVISLLRHLIPKPDPDHRSACGSSQPGDPRGPGVKGIRV